MSCVINPYVWFFSCKTHTEHCSNTKIDFHFSRYFPEEQKTGIVHEIILLICYTL